MITKGILKTINYNENSCTVRIPLFETASSNNEVILSAVFLTQPGSYNGYSEGDIVFIDFENNSLNSPIVLGKLYLGAVKEKATSKKGGLTVADLSVTSSASLPLDTKLTFDKSDSTVVSVEGGLSTYNSLLDIIKALYKTETSVTKATEEALGNITKIKVEYLSQLVEAPEPTKENPNWDIVVPVYQDGHAIWQKTTCYNTRDQILSTEIVCLSSITTTSSYWLKCSTRSHAGTQQKDSIQITAMIKLGSAAETEDTSAVLKYKWQSDTDWTVLTNTENTAAHKFEIASDKCKDENLLIKAYHEETEYESETIVFAPLNTPTLVLTNYTDSLAYDSDGTTKLNWKDTVAATARLLLNNKEVPNVTYKWTLTNCKTKDNEDAEITGSELSISYITSDYDYTNEETGITERILINSGTAVCTVEYSEDLILTATFTINKNRAGQKGEDGKDGENGKDGINGKDGENGKDGNSIDVQYAFCWTNDYLITPTTGGLPADFEKPSDYLPPVCWSELNPDWWADAWTILDNFPTAENMDRWNPSWCLIFISNRTITKNGSEIISCASWSKPEVFLVKNEDAYNILTTANGLFGYGQGVYYTPTETITLADGSTKNAGDPITQEQATKFVALDPDTNKEKVKLYIDANYIRTGAFTVKDGNNILFQAGLDTGVNKTPIVKIAGFDVGTNGIYNTDFITSFKEATPTNKVNKSGVYIGTDGIRLGDSFSVDPNGNVKASSLTISANNVDGLGSLATKNSLSASDVGARPSTWVPSASDVGARPNTWTPTASEVGARPDSWYPSASDVGAVATGDLTNSSSTAYSNIVSIANGCITAASIDAGKITSGSLTIDNKFIADIDRSTVKIGSFDVDGNSLSMGLYDEDGDFIGDALGKTGSLIVCAAGSSTKARIGGSKFVGGWHYTAGRNFGVRTDPTTKESELYASRGKIGNWNILPRTAFCESINGIPDYGYTDPEGGNEKTNLVFLYSGSKYKTYDAVSEALTDGFNLGRPDSFEPGCLTVGGNWISPDQDCDFYNNYSYTQLRGGKLGGIQFGVTNLYKGQDYEIYCPMLALWDLGAKDVAQIGNPDIHGEYARDEAYKGSGIALLRHGYVPGNAITGGTESTWFLCGSWVAESAISIISDRRKKEDIKELNDQYDSLFDQLKPTTFKYKNGNSGRLHTGFIAQDIEEALKKSNLKTTEFAGLVIRNHNYFDDKLQKEQHSTEYSLRYEEFIALNTSQIQKLKSRINILETELTALQKRLDNLEKN